MPHHVPTNLRTRRSGRAEHRPPAGRRTSRKNASSPPVLHEPRPRSVAHRNRRDGGPATRSAVCVRWCARGHSRYGPRPARPLAARALVTGGATAGRPGCRPRRRILRFADYISTSTPRIPDGAPRRRIRVPGKRRAAGRAGAPCSGRSGPAANSRSLRLPGDVVFDVESSQAGSPCNSRVAGRATIVAPPVSIEHVAVAAAAAEVTYADPPRSHPGPRKGQGSHFKCKALLDAAAGPWCHVTWTPPHRLPHVQLVVGSTRILAGVASAAQPTV